MKLDAFLDAWERNGSLEVDGTTIPWDPSLRQRPLTVVAPESPATGGLTFPLRDVDPSLPAPLVDGFLHPVKTTLLYGRGSAGKGVIAAWLVARRTAEGENVMVLDYEANPDEWRRRIEGFGGDIDRVRIALPVTEDRGMLDGPIWAPNQVGRLRAEADEFEISWVVVDSILNAVLAAGDAALSDPSMPRKFYAALRVIGRPALALGHVAGAATDLWKPWGSVYWVNYARMAWSMASTDDGDTRELINQKKNVYQTAGPWTVDWSWADQLPAGETPGDIVVRQLKMSIAKRAATILAEGPATLEEIFSLLNEDGGEPVNKLSLGRKLRALAMFTKVGETWQMAAPIPVQKVAQSA